jgi:hypothetical protein
MVHNLYHFSLYAVYIAVLNFIAVALGGLLFTL